MGWGGAKTPPTPASQRSFANFVKNSKVWAYPARFQTALDPSLTMTTCSQTWLELLMGCPFLLGRGKGIPQTKGGEE